MGNEQTQTELPAQTLTHTPHHTCSSSGSNASSLCALVMAGAPLSTVYSRGQSFSLTSALPGKINFRRDDMNDDFGAFILLLEGTKPAAPSDSTQRAHARVPHQPASVPQAAHTGCKHTLQVLNAGLAKRADMLEEDLVG